MELGSQTPDRGSRRCSDEQIPDEQINLIEPAEEPKFSVSGAVWRALSVLVACTLYLLVGPSLIIINRTLMRERQFNYPMLVSGLGLLFSTAVSFALVRGGCVERKHTALITRRFFVSNLLPIGAALATTLASGNAVYLYLPVGFIQMLKAFTPTVTIAMLYVSGIEVPTVRVACAVVGICAGTAVASLGEGSFNVVGLALMLTAEVSEAVRLVLTQKLLNNLKFGVSVERRRWQPACCAVGASATHPCARPSP